MARRESAVKESFVPGYLRLHNSSGYDSLETL